MMPQGLAPVTSVSEASPPKGYTTFLDSDTIRTPSIETLEPMGDISHSNTDNTEDFSQVQLQPGASRLTSHHGDFPMDVLGRSPSAPESHKGKVEVPGI